MADNTLQFRWIVTIKENLDAFLPDFVGGDLLWYPVQGDPKIRLAPDALVALGRPKGERGSYKQWEEGGIAPQVVFEVLSPKNTFTEMMKKLRFYETYGALEFYIYDPDHDVLEGWSRASTRQTMQPIDDIRGWVSPLLKIRFDTQGPTLVIYRPDGQPFLSFAETRAAKDAAEAARDTLAAERDAVAAERDAVAAERDAVAAERDAVAAERDAVAAEHAAARERAARLEARLRALGIDPAQDG